MRGKAEFTNELFAYVFSVVNNNTSCREVGQWLKVHPYSLESFFMALTIIKHGKLANEDYQAVVEEFKSRHQLEIQQTYSPGFGFAYKSQETAPLYQEIVKLLASNEAADKSVVFK